MSLFKKIFGSKKKTEAIHSNTLFWEWFAAHEKVLFTSFAGKNKAQEALDQIIKKMQQYYPELFALAGMYDDETVELIITPDGDIKNIVFAEELVADAPVLPHWKFTALKPAIGFERYAISIYGFDFGAENIKFYTIPDTDFPDEIDIHIAYQYYDAEKHNEIASGVQLFLENALGELHIATQIDLIQVGPPTNEYDMIPIEKLKDYLLWREKEFIEKYEASRYEGNDDMFSILEAEDVNHLPVIAAVNQNILSWDSKASHPWMLIIDYEFQGNENGMPDEKTNQQMYDFEEILADQLTPSDDTIYLGRETYNNKRSIFFTCRSFRASSKTTYAVIASSGNNAISYTMYKDKYWKTLDQYI